MAKVNDSFLRACVRGDFIKEATRLLSRGADPNVRDEYGQSALHWACFCGNMEFIKTLCEVYQCNTLECKTVDGYTPLHYACLYGRLEVTQYLVSEQHCNPQCMDNDGRTPLHLACWRGHLEFAQYLVSEQHCNPQCTDNDGRTPLHLACNWNKLSVVKFLLSPPMGCDPNLSDNDGNTPLGLTNNSSIIRDLLLHGANPKSVYEQKACGDALCAVSGHRPESSVKMFVVGDVGAGKSTLTAALKKESKGFSRLTSRLTQVSGVEQKTAGIIPHEIASEKLGRLTLYDLAGHKEFYASHDTALRSTMTASSAAVFLLVADLAKSDEEFRTTVLYWLTLLENQCSSTGTKPHIITIGSHADAVSSKVRKDKKAIVDSLASGPAFSSFYFAGFVAMDCRFSESSSMSELRKCLAKSCESLRDSSTLDFQSHCFLVYLLDQFRHLPAVSLGEILSHIQQHSGKEESDEKLMISRRMPNDMQGLYQSCEELNKRVNLLFIGNVKNSPNSWLVLDRELLLTHVTGSVFAPESFRQHHKLASNTGVVPLSSMLAYFPGLDPDMIACFLSHLDFCHEITDHNVLQLLQSSGSSAQEKYYFFPALISIDAPPEVWKDASKFSCHSAWLLRCSRSEQFFTPRFLHVLLLRLAFSFALAPDSQEVSSDHPALQRKCSVWKNGIYWRNRQGVEALVEVGKDSQRATVMVRNRKGSEIACIHLRSALLQTVLKTRKQFCPRVTTSESFIHPDDASSYPLQLKHSPYTIVEIARAVAEGARYVVAENELALTKDDEPVLELETLLHFEPYAHLGKPFLLRLFDEASPDYTKPADASIIERITRYVKLKIGESPGVFSTPADKLHNLIGKSHSNITYSYRDLRAVLDQFSVFAGRNPLEIAGQLSPVPTGVPETQAKQHPLILAVTPAQDDDSTTHAQPLELSGQLSPLPTDVPETQAKQHPLTSAQGDDSTAPAHSDVPAVIPRKSDKPRLYELQKLRGREGSVIRVIRDVAAQWDDLAIALQFENEVATIRANTHHQAEDAFKEVFHRWLSEDPEEHHYRTPVTWNTLLEALRDCEFTVLARDLEEVLH